MVPIALAFANFNALEVPVIFGLCVATWGYLRLIQTWRRRWILVSAFGFFHAFNADWAAYFFGAVLLAFMLPRGILLNGRWYPGVDRRRFAQWWSLSASIAVGLILLYVWQFQRAGQLSNLLSQGIHRSVGGDLPLESVLQSRAHWIELAFTPPAIFIGKAAVPLLLFRFVFMRREAEIFPLAFLFMATVQYVVFKQGADIHFFWPHYFAPYFALAMGCLTGSFEGVLRFIVQRFRRQGRLWPPIIAFAVFVLVPLSMIPDGVTGLVYARRTGGRYDERGDLIQQDIDKVSVLKQLRKRFEPDTTVAFHEGMKLSWNVDWAIRRPTRVVAPPTTRANGEAQYYFLDSRFIYAKELGSVAEKWHVEAYGPFWFFDRSTAKGPIDGFSLVEREPTRLEWYFRQGVESHLQRRARSLRDLGAPAPSPASAQRDAQHAPHDLRPASHRPQRGAGQRGRRASRPLALGAGRGARQGECHHVLRRHPLARDASHPGGRAEALGMLRGGRAHRSGCDVPHHDPGDCEQALVVGVGTRAHPCRRHALRIAHSAMEGRSRILLGLGESGRVQARSATAACGGPGAARPSFPFRPPTVRS